MDLTRYYLRTDDRASMTEAFKRMKNYILPDFEAYSLEIFQFKKFPVSTDENIIRMILKDSPQKLNIVRKQKQYYLYLMLANLNCLRKIIDSNLEEVEDYVISHKLDNGLIYYNVFSHYDSLLKDAMLILQEYSQHFPNQQHKPSWQSINIQNPHPNIVFSVARKLLTGTLIDNSSTSTDDPHITQLLLRHSIELEIRQRFGLYAVLDKRTGNQIPISMDNILRVLLQKHSDLPSDLPIELFCLIYRWCNLFTHTGFRDYITKLIFIVEHVSTYFQHNEWSGTKESVFYEIHDAILNITVPKSAIRSDYEMVSIIKPNLWASDFT